MSKILVSPVEAFPGTITLPDRLTLHQVAVWEKSVSLARRLPPGDAQVWEVALPALAEIVIDWSVEGVDKSPTADNFPYFPYAEACLFTRWVREEVSKLNMRETVIPKVSNPPLVDGSTVEQPPTN